MTKVIAISIYTVTPTATSITTYIDIAKIISIAKSIYVA